MDKDKNDLKIVSLPLPEEDGGAKFEDMKKEVENDELPVILPQIIKYAAIVKELYIDLFTEEDDDPPLDILQGGADIEREFRNAMLESAWCHVDLLDLYFEESCNGCEGLPNLYSDDWMRWFSDEDQRINALRLLNAIQSYIIENLLHKIVELNNEQKNEARATDTTFEKAEKSDEEENS